MNDGVTNENKKNASKEVVIVDGAPRKRGRPRGSKNLPKKRDPVRIVKEEPSSGPTLKTKIVHAVESRMTLMQMHDQRLAHINSAEDMDAADIDYMISSCKYMAAHTEDNSKKASLLKEYINECFGNTYDGQRSNVKDLYTQTKISNSRNASMPKDNMCPCGSSCFVVDARTATRICTDCGESQTYQEFNMSDIWSDERVQVLSKVAYKRVNHMREILNSIQARQQCTPALQCVIERVKRELKKERVTDMSTITPLRIRQYLHNLRLGKFYEFASCIYFEVTKKEIPKFSAELEHAMMSMFVSIQPVFDSLPGKSRKNFLSYSFVLNKFSSILGEDHLLQFFPLLKSREKLYLQDQIWKRICQSMNWQFKPSI